MTFVLFFNSPSICPQFLQRVKVRDARNPKFAPVERKLLSHRPSPGSVGSVGGLPRYPREHRPMPSLCVCVCARARFCARASCRVGRTARAGRPGWSLSFVSQYDVELLQKIEGLIGHQLEQYDCPEAEVLKGITRVFAARRAAAMRIADGHVEGRRGGGGGSGRTAMEKGGKEHGGGRGGEKHHGGGRGGEQQQQRQGARGPKATKKKSNASQFG